MPQRICNWFTEHGANISEQPAVIARAIVEGLAGAYGQAIDHLRQLTGFSLTDLTIVGGGNQHALLNQLTAKATGCVVHRGHLEATAWGNACLIQGVIGYGR